MQQPALPVNEIAPLVNVATMHAAAQRTMDRPRHLPGMVAFYGPAGWGKTFAAAFTANSLDAYHIQILDFWNKKTFFEQLCIELGIKLKEKEKTIGIMGAKVCESLGISQKLLIIDEVDIAIKNGFIDSIRAIFEGSKTSVIMIGEESLPEDLLRWERIHSRVLEWVPAEPPDIKDCTTLVSKFARDGIKICDDMITKLFQDSGPSLRRICINIERIQDFARENGIDEVNTSNWGNRQLYSGEAPVRVTGVKPPKRRR